MSGKGRDLSTLQLMDCLCMASDGEEGYSIDGIKTTVLQMKEDGI